MVTIYALINPIDNNVFYIGATIHPDKRLQAHISDLSLYLRKKALKRKYIHVNEKKCLLIKKIIAAGKMPIFKILKKADIKEAGEVEFKYKQFYQKRGHELCLSKCDSKYPPNKK